MTLGRHSLVTKAAQPGPSFTTEARRHREEESARSQTRSTPTGVACHVRRTDLAWYTSLLLHFRFPVQNKRHWMCRAIVVVGIDDEALAIAGDVVDDHFSGRDPLTGIGLKENCRRAGLEFGLRIDGGRHQLRVG